MLYRVLFILLYLFLSYKSIAQKLPEVFNKSDSELSLGDVRDYYLNKYNNLNICDSVAKENSKLLESKNERHFIFNELARIQILSLQENAVVAIEQLEKLKTQKKITNDNILLGYYYNVYGSIYYHFNQPKKAQNKYKKAVQLFITTIDSSGLKGNLINLGNTFLDLEESDSALYYYNEALVLERAGVLIFSNTLKSNIAQAYLRSDQLDAAKYCYLQLVKEFRKEKNSYKLVNAIMNLGITLQNMNQLDSAILFLKEASFLASEYNLPGALKKSTLHLAHCHEEKGNFKIALKYSYSYDSIINSQNEINLEEKISELNRTQQQKIFLKKQKIDQINLEAQKRRTAYFVLVSILIALILIFILFSFFKIKGKNRLLTEISLATAKKDVRITLSSKSEIDKELIDRLLLILEKDKIYLEPKLSLEILAKKLDSNRTYLSKSINQYFKMPYSNLINQYRIREACVLLVSEKYNHYSIEGIAITVGYNNLSSFNSAFKRITGSTPSEFKNKSITS